MNIEQFAEIASLDEETELGKIAPLVFFLSKDEAIKECHVSKLLEAFDILHFTAPNKTRLKTKIGKSKDFIRGSGPDGIRLHANTIKKLKQSFSFLMAESNEIVTLEKILPKDIYKDAPSFIVKLADQVNGAFDAKIYDGCAVLMRRLLEVSLIVAYQKIGIGDEIKGGDGNYKMLDGIINNAKTNGSLALSRNAKKSLDDLKKLGNFAAHRIEFSTRRMDIEHKALEFRATIEELLIKSGY